MSSSATICNDHAADFRRFAMLDRYTEVAASQVASDIFKQASGEVRKRTSNLDMSDHARYRPMLSQPHIAGSETPWRLAPLHDLPASCRGEGRASCGRIFRPPNRRQQRPPVCGNAARQI